LQGEVTDMHETGEELRLKPGNVVVERKTARAWVAHGTEPALMLGIILNRTTK
jgi:hypothetical protein